MDLLEQLAVLHEALTDQKGKMVDIFSGEEGEILLTNALISKVVSSFKQTRPGSGPFAGKQVTNPDFQKAAWSAKELHDGLPDRWRQILADEDVTTRLEQWVEEEEAFKNQDESYVQVLSKGKSGPATVYSINYLELMRKLKAA